MLSAQESQFWWMVRWNVWVVHNIWKTSRHLCCCINLSLRKFSEKSLDVCCIVKRLKFNHFAPRMAKPHWVWAILSSIGLKVMHLSKTLDPQHEKMHFLDIIMWPSKAYISVHIFDHRLYCLDQGSIDLKLPVDKKAKALMSPDRCIDWSRFSGHTYLKTCFLKVWIIWKRVLI